MVFDIVVALAITSIARCIGDHLSPGVAVYHRAGGCVPRRPTPQPGLRQPTGNRKELVGVKLFRRLAHGHLHLGDCRSRSGPACATERVGRLACETLQTV
jgi:hypothetical protein